MDLAEDSIGDNKSGNKSQVAGLSYGKEYCLCMMHLNAPDYKGDGLLPANTQDDMSKGLLEVSIWSPRLKTP